MAAISDPKRKSGISLLGDAPWGTHFCQFYRTKQDLIDILVPYFKAGLENNEFCMWVTSEPLSAEEARAELQKAVKDLAQYDKKGQIEILDFSQWYTRTGKFDAGKVLQGWVDKEQQARKNGFEGLRLSGNTFWLEPKDWKSFSDYEATVNDVVHKYNMFALCTYSLGHCDANQILDVFSTHQFAFINRNGEWTTIESTERKRAEMSLAQSETRLEMVVEASLDAILAVDERSHIVLFNAAAEELFGYSAEEVIDAPVSILLSESVAGAHQKRVEKFMGRGVGQCGHIGRRVEKVFLRKNGTTFVAEVAMAGGRSNAKRLVVTSIHDITERKRAEEALRETEERYRALFDRSLDLVFIHDFEGRFIDANNAALNRFGYQREEIGSLNFSSLLSKDQLPLALKTLQEIRETGTQKLPTEYRLLHKDGTHAYVETQGSTILSSGKPVAILGIGRDLTERKRAEEALANSEEKYRLVVQNASQGIVVLQDGMLKFINAWAIEFMAYPESEVLSKPFLSFVFPEDQGLVAEHYEKRLKGESAPPVYSFRLMARTGQPRLVEVSATRVLWEGQPAALAFLTDIAERRHLEEQVLQLQKMEAVGRLAGGVAHDYNNLLQVIMGYGEMLEKGLPTDDPLRKYVAGIQKAADRAASLTKQLLAFSRRQAVMPVVLDLSRAVAEAGKMLRRLIGEDIEMTTELVPDLGRVRADMVQVEQMIMNLALNARDAMSQGGKLTLRTANVVLDEAFTASRLEVSPGPYVLLEVSDTGHGMDESTLAHIFEPFFTTREKGQGTGLGLSMVYGIVKQSGGHIEVESAPGKGATFKVYFPRIEEEEQQRKSAPAETTLPGGTETVLLVEDEPEIRGLIREVLSAQGYSVLEAGNGEEALRLSGELPGPIHLLLTDVVMPGMSGRDLAQRLAALRPDMKLLFMSGYTDDAIIRHGLLVEKLAFLQKPFRPEALLRKVRETLDAS